MKHLLLALFSLLSFGIGFGQSKNYTFKVMDVRNNSIPFASIKVKSVLDSTKQFALIADSNGVASANIASNKNYTIQVNAIGYKKYSKTIALENSSIVTIKLLEDPTQLNQVVVTSSKALVRQEDDKAIVDPEPLAAGSTNAMETIEKTPGIFIDSDGNIYLNGLSPAGVQINGRDLKMSPSDLATLLKSLPPNVIQKIELIRTPSAKYDASGGGGVVNIVLKKGVKLGLNGSINTGLNQGQYGNQFFGVNLNNTNDKYSTYLNTQYNNNNGYSINNTNRILSDQSTIIQRARTQNPSNSFYVGYGIGKNYKEKWEFNYDGRMSNNLYNNTTKNNAGIASITGLPLLNESIINNKGNNYNINQSFRSKYKLDTLSG
ncbi:MAG: TonB-dependent receptor, partial [Sediminibacterium sp.]